MPAIKTEKLTKYYQGGYGIIDLDLQVEEGESFGLIGPNGSGKTTTLRTLLHLIHPTTGTASVFGMDIVKQSAEIKQVTGYVPAEAVFYKDMRARDIFKMVASMRGESNMERIAHLSDMLGVDCERKFGRMPLGARKKVALIQALIGAPRLLLLDEPLLGFDDGAKRYFFELMDEECRKGTTLLYCSQNAEEVRQVCRHTAFINKGSLLPEADVDDYMKYAAHRIKVKTEEDISPALSLLEATDCRMTEGYVSFFTEKPMDVIVKAMANYSVLDLRVESPSAEDAIRYLSCKKVEIEEEAV